MRILVLGAYGFIGLDVASRLARAGHEVIGLGRLAQTGQRLLPAITWIGADLATLLTPSAWTPHLEGIEAVVNAAGALQDGGRDDVKATQQQAITALIAACEAGACRCFVQISAPGAEGEADTAFMRTKGVADQRLRDSTLDWTILKPGLVIGANAYGGMALLRMLAAMPLAEVLVLGDRTLQTVALSDVADAVAMAIDGQLPQRATFDLVSPESHRLRDLVGRLRVWLGLPRPRFSIALPERAGFALAKLADLAGWFGWRSPLRTTALKVLARDISGDSQPWTVATGCRLLTLDETLAALPATRQERLFARAQLSFPLLVVTLAAFWLLSGLIGLWRYREAAALLPDWLSVPMATSLVVTGSIVDLTIGLGLLLRRWLPAAALGSVAVSLSYLLAGTLLRPELWADPLGPLVKVLPAIALALAVLAFADER